MKGPTPSRIWLVETRGERQWDVYSAYGECAVQGLLAGKCSGCPEGRHINTFLIRTDAPEPGQSFPRDACCVVPQNAGIMCCGSPVRPSPGVCMLAKS